ncbi:nickel transporter [Brenneria populi]|uniref:Nickel/cobalt efflux system n=1 Tax=Brenneria populi TaxID=1505588 RepID=A0ABU6JLR7_9GAMM|nr:nickel transporter [Brenneria populi Li et al. 2015]
MTLSIQIYLHRYLIMYLLQIQNNNLTYSVLLLAASFTYGVLHAIGPGHGKFVISSYLSVSDENASSARLISFLGAMAQGGAAILFVYALVILFNFAIGDLSRSRWYVEKISAIYIGIFGMALLLRSYKSRPRVAPLKIRKIISAPAAEYRPGALLIKGAENKKVIDNGSACCSHHHGIAAGMVPRDVKSALWVILAIGSRPCTGAILLLVFSNAVGIINWGIAAVMSMALGTSLAVTILATLVIKSRDKAILLYGDKNHTAVAKIRYRMLAVSGALLLIMAVALFSSTVPVSMNGDFIAAGC